VEPELPSLELLSVALSPPPRPPGGSPGSRTTRPHAATDTIAARDAPTSKARRRIRTSTHWKYPSPSSRASGRLDVRGRQIERISDELSLRLATRVARAGRC